MTAERAPDRAGEIAEAQLRALLRATQSGVLIFDAAGRPVLTNECLAPLLGLPPESLADLSALDNRLAALAANFRDAQSFGAEWHARRMRAEQPAWEELEMLRPARRLIERSARPVWGPGGCRAGWLEVYRDITGQRTMHSKLLQTEKMAALGQLVSGITHELNNPLTSIMGYAQLLLSRSLPPERIADVRLIYEEAERASRIVKNLLTFARETKPVREPVDLNETIERTMALRGYELKVENIVVELHLDPRLPSILADATQMQQVILNLVVNAEQAIQQGRGSGHISVRSGRWLANRVFLEVSDDGPGIAPEVASRIFDPFFTTKAVGVGTGLGLSIVYGIVREHGGEISMESLPGRGAKFRIELPVAAELAVGTAPHAVAVASASPAQETPLADQDRPAIRADGERVLIVEDEPTVAQLIADVLSEEGYQADRALDSREALARIARGKYALLICDIRMPHLDGPAFYRALVQAGDPLQHHMLIITGDTLSFSTLEFLERSGLPYVAKPFLVEELKLAVQHALASPPSGVRIPAVSRALEWPQTAGRKK